MIYVHSSNSGTVDVDTEDDEQFRADCDTEVDVRTDEDTFMEDTFTADDSCAGDTPLTADETLSPVSILYKSTAGRYRPVRVADGPITARCRFIKNASWVCVKTLH